jgi:Zn-finger nucleic acid-binding protein
MKCPHCTEPDLTMSNRDGVEIDYCPRCRGVWLDRGELDKIIERASRYEGSFSRDRDDDDDDDDYHRRTPPPPPPYPNTYAPHGDSRSDYRYKKRKSFWSELFD